MLEPVKEKKLHIVCNSIHPKDVQIMDEDGNIIDGCYEFTIHSKVGEVTTCEIKLFPEKVDIIAEEKKC